ncbi:MAG: hypothetical protein WDM71_03175 [Ferruginibacter sp.]
MKSIFTIAFTLLVAIGYAQNSAADELATYKKNEYRIQYPMGWSIDTSGQSGTVFIIYSPRENEADHFLANVNLVIQQVDKKNNNLDSFVRQQALQIRANETDGQIYEATKVETDKDVYYKLISSATKGVTLRLKYEQYFFIKNNNAFVITLTSELDKFDSYKTIGEQILNSFTLTD